LDIDLVYLYIKRTPINKSHKYKYRWFLWPKQVLIPRERKSVTYVLYCVQTLPTLINKSHKYKHRRFLWPKQVLIPRERKSITYVLDCVQTLPAAQVSSSWMLLSHLEQVASILLRMPEAQASCSSCTSLPLRGIV
jgi:hypothetical protein